MRISISKNNIRHAHRRCLSSNLPSSSGSSNNNNNNSIHHHQQPLSLGYVAGLQTQSASTSNSNNDDLTWTFFDEAYEILQQVDPEVLLEFETDLWEQDGMKFVHSTKEISVIDLYHQHQLYEPNHTTKAVRSLIFNARPSLIQSSIEVEFYTEQNEIEHDHDHDHEHQHEIEPKVHVQVLWGKPPPLVGLTATHLGGLTLSVPLWLACRKNKKNLQNGNDNDDDSDKNKPRALVLGAGGCTIPSLLKKSGCNVIAIEPSHDVRHAALTYFGAGKADADIVLLPGYGEDFLGKHHQHQPHQHQQHQHQQRNSNSTCSNFDILIIDAEDGQSAPPHSMKDASFWRDQVVPSLNDESVVAVNVIADHHERAELRHLVAEAMPSHHVWYCKVPSIAEVSSRHCILFATIDDNIMPRVKEAMDEFDYVDMKSEWIKEMELARLKR